MCRKIRHCGDDKVSAFLLLFTVAEECLVSVVPGMGMGFTMASISSPKSICTPTRNRTLPSRERSMAKKTPEERRAYYALHKDEIEAVRRAWRNRPEVRERINAERRKRRAKDEEFRKRENERRNRNRDPEKLKEYRRRYYELHKDEIKAKRKEAPKAHSEPPKPRTDEDRARSLAYYAANKERILGYIKKYHAAHRQEINAKNRERRAKERGA